MNDHTKHYCTIGTTVDGKPIYENQGNLIEPQYNYCPVCGSPIDWTKVGNGKTMPEEKPRLKILDATGGNNALPVVYIYEEDDGSLVMIGDDYSLDSIEAQNFDIDNEPE